MSIVYSKNDSTLTLHTRNTTYQMKIDPRGFLWHTYYGSLVPDMDMSYLLLTNDRACAGNPDEVYPDRTLSFDILPQEYTGSGVGDYRINSMALVNPDGSRAVDFRFVDFSIEEGKYAIPGLPAAYDNGGEAETLIVTLKDPATDLVAELYYGVFEEADIITRSVRIRNDGQGTVKLRKAASLCLDLPSGSWDLIHFHGKHALEKQFEREPIRHAVTAIGSSRGTSSHQQNPFVIVCDSKTNEDHGSCYGLMLVYSGGFKCEAEADQLDAVRLVMGLQNDGFSWELTSGSSFETPEVIMSYSDRGLTPLSQNYHHIVRHNICRGRFKLARRPILINNWEATYFDFDDDKILKIAESAADLGVEMLVLDDGWFGVRNSDDTGLGDWFVNRDKIRRGMKALAEGVNRAGLKFGLWIEPEMVSEASELYHAHPEWVIRIPGRKPVRARNQLVLDMSRPDVRDYLYERISSLLSENHIEYIKWDMNRSLSDMYSAVLPADRQGELAHRYVLGLYDLMERLTSQFPDVLFEGCSGGGARFDAGILYYSPQIWCSDDTDPIHRLSIQYGSSFAYPVSTVGAHVSASPNHQTGRHTPINTRGIVAMSGTFGYELDPTRLSEEDRAEIREQIGLFKTFYDLIQNGRYYRLTDIGKCYYEAWSFVTEDKSKALLNLVITNPQPNPTLINIRFKGLDAGASYRISYRTRVDEKRRFGFFGNPSAREDYENDSRLYKGSALMNGGYTLPWIMGDYPALQLCFERCAE